MTTCKKETKIKTPWAVEIHLSNEQIWFSNSLPLRLRTPILSLYWFVWQHDFLKPLQPKKGANYLNDPHVWPKTENMNFSYGCVIRNWIYFQLKIWIKIWLASGNQYLPIGIHKKEGILKYLHSQNLSRLCYRFEKYVKKMQLIISDEKNLRISLAKQDIACRGNEF